MKNQWFLFFIFLKNVALTSRWWNESTSIRVTSKGRSWFLSESLPGFVNCTTQIGNYVHRCKIPKWLGKMYSICRGSRNFWSALDPLKLFCIFVLILLMFCISELLISVGCCVLLKFHGRPLNWLVFDVLRVFSMRFQFPYCFSLMNKKYPLIEWKVSRYFTHFLFLISSLTKFYVVCSWILNEN